MRRRTAASTFPTIRIEGGLLTPEFLQTIAMQEAEHQKDEEYGLSRSLHMRDELNRYWRIANDLYQSYRQVRTREDVNQNETCVSRWLLPLIQDVLGYRDITPCSGVNAGDRYFPVTHMAFGGSVPMVLTNEDIDHPSALFGDEGRRRSPFGLIQEYLNAEKDALWGIVSNASCLRLLRENHSLTRQSFIEVDLDRMFEEQLYSDFAAIWLLLHETRLRPVGGRSSGCILEQWRKDAQDTGQRALQRLRYGVKEALLELGNGFLEHPDNQDLRAAIKNGRLTPVEFQRELLRLVYRILFLLVAEDRDLLHPPSATPEQRELYRKGYSLSMLRDRALRRRPNVKHSDLWQGLRIVFRGLAGGAEPLGLPALGGLFANDQCPTLDASLIGNGRLLSAIRALAYFRTEDALTRVNYREMNTEELGSIYEGLLELHPFIHVDTYPWTFELLGNGNGDHARGSERKSTGSYYTHPSLVEELIQSTLEPVMEQAIKDHPNDPKRALLNLKVIDPACGSGHFLLAAARRLAAELARIEAVSDTPDETTVRHALREVVRHCVYGVDRNPLAVELCKTALWIEAVEPGKPLAFLDARIVCGDSLLGVLDPAILQDGIPDKAYTALAGDDRKVCNLLKKKNRQQRVGKGNLQMEAFDVLQETAAAAPDFENLPEETLEDIEAKRRAIEEWRNSVEWRREKLRADLFVGAFLAPKTVATADLVPVSADLLRMDMGLEPRPSVSEYVSHLASAHVVLHWHLTFPEVMAKGGFDVLIGNPPWEVMQLSEVEYFASRLPSIAAKVGDERKEAIEQLKNMDFNQWLAYQEYKREIEAKNLYYRTSGRFRLASFGKLNSYALFSELFLQLISRVGRAGIVVPSGIATDDSTKRFFEEISTSGRLVSLYDFENREGLFPSVDSRQKFCLLTVGNNVPQATFVFFATRVDHVRETERQFTLSPDEINLINPNTKTCPVFRSKADAELTKKIYRHVPIFVNENLGIEGNPWGIEFSQGLFNMTSHSYLFRTYRQLEQAGAERQGQQWVDSDGNVWVPLYEGKMIHHYDHRWATYDEAIKDFREVTEEEKRNFDFEPLPRYWVPEQEVENRIYQRGWNRKWLLGWRDITNATNERTVIATFFPWVGVGNKLPIVLVNKYPTVLIACLGANLSALSLDFIARNKVGGTSLNFFYIKQFPLFPPETYSDSDVHFIVQRVLELVFTSKTMRPFAKDLGYHGSPFQRDNDRRAVLQAELDAYFARLYGLTRDELRYILDPADVYGPNYPSETFRVLKEKEIKQYGEYRTARLVLDAWDRLASMRIGESL